MQQQIQRIEEKVQKLLKEYHHAQKELQRLQKENAKLQALLHTRNEQANELQQKVDALKINSPALETDTKKDLEKRINTYLKDIDKCLALLHA